MGSEAEAAVDNQLALLLSAVSEVVGMDGARDEQRERWLKVTAAFPRSAGAILALLEAELAFVSRGRRVRP